MKTTMNTMEYKRYGGPEVFVPRTLSIPVPKANELLIRIHATTVTAADVMMRRGKPLIGRLYLGLRAPKKPILGFEFAGDVIAVGNDVTNYKAGERVYGGTTALGCYAEYACISASDVICKMPENLAYQQAAPVTGSAITVVNLLKRKARIQPNHHVLINGASGALGTYAVQYAKIMGAHVTAVCSSANLELVKSLGADNAIDYTQTDFTKNTDTYDIIFDTVGKLNYGKCKKSLVPKGIFVSSVAGGTLLLQLIWTSLFTKKKVTFSATGMLPVKTRLEYLEELNELLKKNQLRTVIDSSYPLAKMIDAHRHVEQGHKKGNCIIQL